MKRRVQANLQEKEDPLLFERALIDVDNEIFRLLPNQEVERELSRLEKVVRKMGSEQDLLSLVNAGCQKQKLLWLLGQFDRRHLLRSLQSEGRKIDFPIQGYGPGSVMALFGISPRGLQKLWTQIEKTAVQIEKINKQRLISYLLTYSASELKNYRELPDALLAYSQLLQRGAQSFGNRSHPFLNAVKARLTRYVVNSANGDLFEKKRARHNKKKAENMWDDPSANCFHDKEVSALIAAMTGNDYDGSTHKTWRGKHYKRLRSIDSDLTHPFEQSLLKKL